ncbi:hypothetical protein J8273_2969 [Carpediemonas membranifera]|uniref:Uncharacterized protein n=1 Tax=Carpediemonas membranifera TaxID=201153 RepID=A0A8J6B977_9EUKA|nr:hypothetical protein J8273_2969 [Carpediemonas membranifera]|eukprot:KAG9395402.1 hypothetical protein J8273_2969 [Carpediemonas membranifera]
MEVNRNRTQKYSILRAFYKVLDQKGQIYLWKRKSTAIRGHEFAKEIDVFANNEESHLSKILQKFSATLKDVEALRDEQNQRIQKAVHDSFDMSQNFDDLLKILKLHKAAITANARGGSGKMTDTKQAVDSNNTLLIQRAAAFESTKYESIKHMLQVWCHAELTHAARTLELYSELSRQVDTMDSAFGLETLRTELKHLEADPSTLDELMRPPTGVMRNTTKVGSSSHAREALSPATTRMARTTR